MLSGYDPELRRGRTRDANPKPLTDGDGYIHSVEWMDLVRNTFETPEKELDDAQIAVLFRRLDRHNTGFLSLSQLMKFFSVGAAAEPFDEEKAAEPAEPSGGEFNRASAADFSRRPSMRKRTSIHELRKDLEALDSTDEVGPPPAAPDAAPADDKEYLDGEESWRQAVYKKERTRRTSSRPWRRSFIRNAIAH